MLRGSRFTTILWTVAVGCLHCGSDAPLSVADQQDAPSPSYGEMQAAPNPYSVGVPRERTVEMLTDAEGMTICLAIGNGLADALNALTALQLCTATGIVSTLSREDCELNTASCVTDLTDPARPTEETMFSGSTACALADANLRSGCTVTVAEIEQCFEDAVVGIPPTAERATCDAAGQRDVILELENSPPSCEAFRARCPLVAPNSILLLLP